MTKQEQMKQEEIETAQEEIAESSDDEEKEMTKPEARDYADEQIDEKFMEDVSEPKMTPERAAKKIKEFEEEIETLKCRIEEIEKVADLPNLDPLKDLVKEQTINAVENMTSYDMKESANSAKAGLKGLESIAFTEGLLRQIRSELSSKKSRIEFFTKEIESLKAQGYQGNLFEGAEEVNDKKPEAEENVEIKEENQEEVGE